MPPDSFSDKNKSALANAGFVEEAISELLLTNRVLRPIKLYYDCCNLCPFFLHIYSFSLDNFFPLTVFS